MALATAAGGEDDFANDKLSSLRTVGSGFSSLIYNLKTDIDFQELYSRCSSVWNAYEKDRSLPKMLVNFSISYLNLFDNVLFNVCRYPAIRILSGTSQ